MADFTTKLELISKRGTPVGAEELIERIEARLGGDPLIVVTKQRMGALMTKTDQPVTTKPPGPGRGLVWALAAFVAVLAVAGIYLATSGGDDEVAETTPTTVAEPTPTTAASVETAADLETIESGVAALYSGDDETAMRLFDLSASEEPRTDEDVATEAAYQGAIGGRLTINDCIEPATSGDPFRCSVRYENTVSDAIGFRDKGETFPVTVRDGQIVEWPFHEHSWILESIASFLALERSTDMWETCVSRSTACAAIQVENAESWADWYQSRDPLSVVQDATTSWFGGDCVAALSFSAWSVFCSDPADPAALTVQYEGILDAKVSLENCEVELSNVTCDVLYANALNEAVGKPPAVINRSFRVTEDWRVANWFQSSYPQDDELRQSFRTFAESGELGAAYQEAGCATSRTPECANLMMDNLDDWAAWHQENN